MSSVPRPELTIGSKQAGIPSGRPYHDKAGSSEAAPEAALRDFGFRFG
jgi:hypothetical protein